MKMRILEKPIKIEELNTIAADTFIDMVKAVVDIRLGQLAIDAELHSDLEALLLEKGSKRKDLWGINLYPRLEGADLIEFDSMINIRPSQGNKSRSVDDENVRLRIIEIVNKWVER